MFFHAVKPFTSRKILPNCFNRRCVGAKKSINKNVEDQDDSDTWPDLLLPKNYPFPMWFNFYLEDDVSMFVQNSGSHLTRYMTTQTLNL